MNLAITTNSPVQVPRAQQAVESQVVRQPVEPQLAPATAPQDPLIPGASVFEQRFAQAMLALAAEVRLEASDLDFSSALRVQANDSLRFTIPVYVQSGGRPMVFPATYPQGATDSRGNDLSGQSVRNKDGESIAGQPITSWDGKPIVDSNGQPRSGLVFWNDKDHIFQGVEIGAFEGELRKMLIFDNPSAEQKAALMAEVERRGGPTAIDSFEALESLLGYAWSIGMRDRYDSNVGYNHSDMVAERGPQATSTGVDAYGTYRRTKDQLEAILVPGPAHVGSQEVEPEGRVFLDTGKKDEDGNPKLRSVELEAFLATYETTDGKPIDLAALPRQSM